MTRFTALLACRCFQFPDDASRLAEQIEALFETDSRTMPDTVCPLHGHRPVLAAIQNGHGVVALYGEPT